MDIVSYILSRLSENAMYTITQHDEETTSIIELSVDSTLYPTVIGRMGSTIKAMTQLANFAHKHDDNQKHIFIRVQQK